MSMSKITLVFVFLWSTYCFSKEVKIGFNYPETGPYSVQGLDQLRAAQIAIDEINAQGGILGSKIKLVKRDSKSDMATTRDNVIDLIENEKVKMVFGGSSSSVALIAGNESAKRKIPFFGTLTYQAFP